MGEAWPTQPPPGQQPQPSGEAWAPGVDPAAAGQQWPAQAAQPSGEAWPAQAVPGQQPPPTGDAWAAGGGGYGPPPGSYGPTGGPPGQVPPSGGDTTRRNLLILIGILAVVALGAGAFVLTSGGDESGEEVVLEPIGSVQQDDFAGNLDLAGDLGAGLAGTSSGEPEFGSGARATLAARTASGSAPGLYGGTRDEEVCDTEALVDFLADPANSAQAAAWAEVHGISPAGIGDYVDGLTAVRLRYDTRVTNHGFRDGGANPFQSLLQAGTAVLVDTQGVPRVKCNCGNPLLEPTRPEGGASDSDLDIESVAQNPGDAWEGLDSSDAVTVEPGEAIDEFTVVATGDGSLFARPAGSNGEDDDDVNDFGDLCDQFAESPTCGGDIDLGTGEMQVTLEWESSADIDIAVTEPDGTELFWDETGPSANGGELDVDSNMGCEPEGSIENVFWNDSPAPGSYTVEVRGYHVGEAGTTDMHADAQSITDTAEREAYLANECGDGDYVLTIRRSGQPDEVYEGTVAFQETESYPIIVG